MRDHRANRVNGRRESAEDLSMKRNEEIVGLIAEFDAQQNTKKNRNRVIRSSHGRVASARRAAELAKLVVGAVLGSFVLVALIALVVLV